MARVMMTNYGDMKIADGALVPDLGQHPRQFWRWFDVQQSRAEKAFLSGLPIPFANSDGFFPLKDSNDPCDVD